MYDGFFGKAEELKREGTPFAIAVVVRSEAPISGKPGDKAIVTGDGRFWGWIGGGCSRPVVEEEARQSLKERTPRVVQIRPDAEEHDEHDHHMHCHSGGALEIYVEPVLPPSRLLVFGDSPVARSLVKLAENLSYDVISMDGTLPAPSGEASDTFVVIASQGDNDEEILKQALGIPACYQGLVASKRKAEALLPKLRSEGFETENVKAPAGLDLKGSRPEEIALSILAEIITAGSTGWR